MREIFTRLEFHEEAEHLVVVLAREEDLARVQLREHAAHRPHVDAVVVRQPQYCSDQTRGSLKTTSTTNKICVFYWRQHTGRSE